MKEDAANNATSEEMRIYNKYYRDEPTFMYYAINRELDYSLRVDRPSYHLSLTVYLD